MKQFEKLTETEIIERVLKGEKSLYELIVRRFNAYLYKIGRSYNYNHEDTQDLMQDTYIDAFKSLSQFENRSSFKTWIIRIMMNNCYRKREKSSFRNEIMQDVNEHATPMFTNRNNETDKVIQSRELGTIIENSLVKIPLDYRMVFSLREINGLNVSETAAMLNISEANVKVRLNRAKTMLRSEIENAYSASELFEFNLIYCDAMVENVMKKINEL
ncbi:sigma-70 family RNA polymerase sigma factor [Avrilella dinanensis]|uniref:RNA polymerase subunit sigma-24 n=1 Tax=Avrilella dinanensis TaxID=2008672 RepID=A0A2M9R5R1_9FLAO|nr:sigma-70 family RNA polymerase sigma factor [Avrilella dinanensis]PJR04202.1 RNA polymerase subunit sigma-24 [Avrilella dinanensis]